MIPNFRGVGIDEVELLPGEVFRFSLKASVHEGLLLCCGGAEGTGGSGQCRVLVFLGFMLVGLVFVFQRAAS